MTVWVEPETGLHLDVDYMGERFLGFQPGDDVCPRCQSTKGYYHCRHDGRGFIQRYCLLCKREVRDLSPRGLAFCHKCPDRERLRCDGMRRYEIEGKSLPSVTSLLGLLPDPPALKAWKQRTPDHRRIGARRMVVGTLTHFRVSSHLAKKADLPMPPLTLDKSSPPIDAEMRAAVNLYYSWFEDFDEKYDLEPVFLEKVVFHKKLGYAGSADFKGRARRGDLAGKKLLLDWKTADCDYDPNKTPYENYLAQLWAYDEAARDMGIWEADERRVVFLTRGGAVCPPHSEEGKARFMTALAVYANRHW